MKQRIAIIPVAIIGGIVLAATGGFYVRHQIPAPPPMQNQNVAPPLISLAPPPVTVPALAITEQATADRPQQTSHAKREQSTSREPPPDSTLQNAVTETASGVTPVPPIRIRHNRENGAVDPILLAAWQAYRNGDYDTASQHYSEVLDKDAGIHGPPERNALLGMAAIAQQRSQDDLAAKFYGKLLSLDPRDPDARAGMSSLFGANMAAGVESSLKLLLAQHPESAALHFALGNHYAQQSHWGEAEQAYFSACELESDNAQFAFNLAVSLDHLGQEKLAARHYRHALELDSADHPSFDHRQTQWRLNELTQHP